MQSLEATFTRLLPIKLTKVWVLEDTIFDFKGLKFYSSHTHIANLGFLQFARRIIYCIPKSWRKIPKAIWVTDEWSANYFHWMAECMPRIWEGLELSPDSPILIAWPESRISEINGKSCSFINNSHFKNLHVPEFPGKSDCKNQGKIRH